MYIFVFVPAGVYIMKILNIIFPICFAGLQAGVYADEAWLKLLRLTS